MLFGIVRNELWELRKSTWCCGFSSLWIGVSQEVPGTVEPAHTSGGGTSSYEEAMSVSKPLKFTEKSYPIPC